MFNRLKDERGKRTGDVSIDPHQKYVPLDGATHFGYGAGRIGFFRSDRLGDFKGRKRMYLEIRPGLALSLPEYALKPSGHFYGRPMLQSCL